MKSQLVDSTKLGMKYFLFLSLVIVTFSGFSQCHIGSVTAVTATPSASSGQVTVSWNALSPVTDGSVINVGIQYNVLYVAGTSTPVLGGSGVMVAPGTSGTSIAISGLTLGTSYTFRILISATCGDAQDQSTSYAYQFYSTVTASAIITPGVPSLAVGSPTSASSINISWNAATGAASYDYEVSNSTSIIATGNTTGTSTAINGLSSNTNYFYRVRARNATGISSYSAKSSAILTYPAAPTFPAISASAITTTSFKANWNATSGASSYQLEVSADPNFGSFVTNPTPLIVSSTVSPDILGLIGATTYYYRVRAVNSLAGVSVNSAPNQVLTAPVIPLNFSVSSTSSTSTTANWNATSTATAYELFVSTDQNFNVPLTNYNPKTINAPALSDVVNGLLPSTTYYLKLRAKNGTNSYSGYTSTITVTTLVASLPPPTFPSVFATSITTTSFQANWNTVSGANSYQLDVSIDPNFNSFIVNNQVVNGISAIVNNLVGGTTYYYQVRAVNSAGIPSVNSLRKEVLTSPITPTGFSVSSTTSNSMSLNWITAPSAIQYELSVAIDQNFNFPIANYNPKIINAPTISDQIIGLSTSTTYYLRLRAKNGISSYSDYAYTSAQTKPAGGGGGFTLTTNFSSPLIHEAGEAQDISVELTNGTPPITLKLYHRQNSEPNYSIENISLANGSTYKIAINDAWLDKFGMEFYFVASDANNPMVEKKDQDNKPFKILKGLNDVTVPLLSFGKAVKDYQIISFPYKIKDRSQVQDVFEQVMGSYDKKKWRLFQYKEGKTVEYSEGINASNIEQGKAYWFISKEEKTLSFGKGQTYGNALSDAAPFKIALTKGWNQIGNPFPYDLSWSDIQLINPLIGKLNLFDKTNASFTESDALKVFGGGFVFAENTMDLLFPVTLPNKGGRTATSISVDDYDINGWSLPIQLIQGEVTNTLSGIGMRADAMNGKDKFDKVTPPRFLRYVELNAKKNNYEFDLSTDVVQSADNYKWDFIIETNSSESVELKWSKQIIAALSAQLILYDKTNHTLIDMTSQDSYSTVSGANISIYFKKSTVPELNFNKIELGKPYPNPFKDELVIPYDYNPENEWQAEITIYDTHGRILLQRSVDSDVSYLKQFKWDGIIQQGVEASPGLYLYKIAVNHIGEKLIFNGKIIKQ
jgi:hypothetical protein